MKATWWEWVLWVIGTFSIGVVFGSWTIGPILMALYGNSLLVGAVSGLGGVAIWLMYLIIRNKK